MRFILWFFAGLLALAAVLGVALWISAGLSLDRDFHYSAGTAALPTITERSDGLVRITVGDDVFRARVAGLRRAGPAVVLLHGFPQSSAMWLPLIEALDAQGYRVLAFDQRGYSPGARPLETPAYAIANLAEDVDALADAVGFDEFHLVGHDWGCAVGWVVSATNPRVRSWTALSIPHPDALRTLGDGEAPLYVRVFGIRGLAETLLGAFDRMLLHAAYADETPAAARAEYDALFAEPGALTGALNWYRALLEIPGAGVLGHIDVPTLFLYGAREFYVQGQVRTRQRPLMLGPFEELELDADHWLIEQQPEATIKAILTHLERHRSPESLRSAAVTPPAPSP